MKKYITLIMLALTAIAARAQVSAMNVGYCNGIVKTSGTTGFSTTEKDTWVEGAIYIPADMLRLYAGNSIDYVHAGLASALNIDQLTVWVRSSLDGENLASATVTKQTDPKIAKGWNNVKLDQPYGITAESEGVYVGYSFHQTGASVGLSVIEKAYMPTQANACFVKLGSAAQWEDRSQEATMAIEAMVYGDNLPKYNLTLKGITVQPTFVVDKGQLSLTATLRNIATCTITGFDAVCSVSGSDKTYTAHIDQPIAYNEEQTVSFTISPDAITSADPAQRTVTVSITNLTEGADEHPEDNVLSAPFEVVEHDFTRRVLLEEFTTEKCPNCPRVAGILHEYLEENPDKVSVLCHHSAYYTDWLTIPSDNDYLWLFNQGGSTFAPAMLIDRKVNPAWSTMAEASPVFIPSTKDELANYVDTRMKDVAFVSLDITTELTDAQANVTVTGERIKENFTQNPPRIVVVLTEDNIKARSQAGATGEYVHQHVSRQVSSTWGEELQWDGNSYTYRCSLPVMDGYVKENLKVVAYIWDYDASDAGALEVCNSAELPYTGFTDNTTGISSAQAGGLVDGAPAEYYSPGGARLAAPQKGLNIIRTANGKVVKVMVSGQ